MPRDHALLQGLSTEARLLLLAAGPKSTDDEVASLLATQTVDWSALLELADRERATGVLWRRLRHHSLPTLSDALREPFERVAMIADFTASYLEQRIGETMVALNKTGVDALLLKGRRSLRASTASFVERPMGDVDLAVSGGEAERAFATFQAVGWRWDSTEFPRGDTAAITTFRRCAIVAVWTCAWSSTPSCSSKGVLSRWIRHSSSVTGGR